MIVFIIIKKTFYLAQKLVDNKKYTSECIILCVKPCYCSGSKLILVVFFCKMNIFSTKNFIDI